MADGKKAAKTRVLVGKCEITNFAPGVFYWARKSEYDTDFYYAEHYHQSLEVSYVFQGQKTMYINGKKYVFHAGDIALVNSSLVHDIDLKGPFVGLVIMIDKEYIDFVAPNAVHQHFELVKEHPAYQKLKDLMPLIAQAAENHQRLKNNGYVSELLDILIKNFMKEDMVVGSVSQEGKVILTRRIITYLEDHYREELTLDKIANVLNYNKTYLSNLFNATIGIGIFEYLTNIRMEHILAELRNSKDSITLIATRNGFTNIQVFNRNFKKLYNITPLQYRKQGTGK